MNLIVLKVVQIPSRYITIYYYTCIVFGKTVDLYSRDSHAFGVIPGLLYRSLPIEIHNGYGTVLSILLRCRRPIRNGRVVG